MTGPSGYDGDDALPLSSQDAQIISRALLVMLGAAEKITHESFNHPPHPGSTAAELLYDVPEDGGVVMDAYLAMQYSLLSGFDHTRAFVTLTRQERPRATALATLVRGGLESLARSWFLLASTGRDELTHRILSMLHAELTYPARLNEELRTRNGAPSDPIVRQQDYLEMMATRGLGRPVPVAPTGLVASLLDSEFRDGSGRQQYSTLSGIAHAHRMSINRFVVTDDQGAEVTDLVAPRGAVKHLALLSLSAISANLEPLVTLFGDQSRHQELARAATSRAFTAIFTLYEDDEGNPIARRQS